MENPELFQNVIQNDLYYKSISQVSLRLNVKKLRNYDTNNLKKTKIINQIYKNEQIKQNILNIQKSLRNNQTQQMFQKMDQQIFTQNNIYEIFPCYQNFQDDKQFLEKLDKLINTLKIDNNESSTKQGKSGLIEILYESEKEKYLAASGWMKDMSSNLQEFNDFYLQIYEVYKGIESILEIQQKQEKITKGSFQNIILLHQNENKCCERLLHVGSFVQNLLLQNYMQKKLENYRENQQQHIDFWSLCHHNIKELSKFISIHPIYYNNNDISDEQEVIQQNKEKQDDMNFKSQKKLFKKNTDQQTIFPILYNTILLKQQVKIIYSMILLPIISSFNPKFIYLDLQISDQFQIELEGIEYLLRQLQKKANLIVYPCYKYEMDKQDQQNLYGNKLYNSYLNAIVSGISGFKMMKTKTFNDDETPNKILRWGQLMQEQFYQNNIFMQKQIQFLNSQIQLYDSYLIFQDIYQFVIRMQNDTILWIIPLDCYLSNKMFTNYFCYYDQNIIVLFDQTKSTIYSQEITNFPKTTKSQIPQIFNTLQVPKQLIEPSILILVNYLIIIYGHEYSSNGFQFFDGILLFDLKQLEEFKQYERVHDNKSQNLLASIKNRRCPQICQNNGFKSNEEYISFFLIGGEFMKSDHIQNFIEVVYVNINKQTFHSNVINFELINPQTSLKPWPYQLVLEYSYENIHLYLIQTGNYLLKLNKFQFPIDPNYHNFSQLLVQQDDSFKLYNISVKRQKQFYFKIEQLYSKSRNWILEKSQCSQSQIVWKAYITRIVNFTSPFNSKILEPFKKQFFNTDNNTSFQICIELTIQLLIPSDSLEFQNYTVVLDYRIMSLKEIIN